MDGKAIGRRIKAFREARGLTQEELAKMVNVTKETVFNWEEGEIPKSWDDIGRVAAALRTPADYIIQETGMDGMQFSEEELSEIFGIGQDLIGAFIAVTESKHFFDFIYYVSQGSKCEDSKTLNENWFNARGSASQLFDDVTHRLHDSKV